VREPRHRLLLGLWGVVVVLLVLVVVGAARGDTGPQAQARCTHGLSSVGPVVIAHGKVVAGSLQPTTEACLP
jgi:hypothetical protein